MFLFGQIFSGIFLPSTCKIHYVDMQYNYVDMQYNYVDMQDNYAGMQVTDPMRDIDSVNNAVVQHHRSKLQHYYDNMRLIYVYM